MEKKEGDKQRKENIETIMVTVCGEKNIFNDEKFREERERQIDRQRRVELGRGRVSLWHKRRLLKERENERNGERR